MAATAADISQRFSVSSAVAGDATTVTDGRGKYMSQSVAGSTKDTVFDKITQAENAALQVDYRCVFIANLNATASISALSLTLAQVSGGANAAFGLDPTGVTAMNSTPVQAVTIANLATAPAGVVFGTAALAVPLLGPRQCFAVWVRRTATASGAVTSDGCDITVGGTV